MPARKLTMIAGVWLCASSALSAQEPPLQLAPTGGWVADFADQSCALRRTFGDGRTSVLLELRQEVPGIGVEIALASRELTPRRRNPRTALQPNPEMRTHDVYDTFRSDDGLDGLILTDSMLDPTARDRLTEGDGLKPWPEADRDRRMAEITGYAVENAFDRDFVLLTVSLRAPMTVMQTCLDDLMAQWGLDAAAQRTLTRHADTDYDPSWMRGIVQAQVALTGSEGTVRARILVDATGKATACKVLSRSNNTDREAEFCSQVIRRARFEPALDASGQPVASYFMWRITALRRTTTTFLR